MARISVTSLDKQNGAAVTSPVVAGDTQAALSMAIRAAQSAMPTPELRSRDVATVKVAGAEILLAGVRG
jgi:hypothetical protein